MVWSAGSFVGFHWAWGKAHTLGTSDACDICHLPIFLRKVTHNKKTNVLHLILIPYSYLQRHSCLITQKTAPKKGPKAQPKDCLASSTAPLTIPLHFHIPLISFASILSTSPGNVAPAYPVHNPGAKTTCLNQVLLSSPFAYRNFLSKNLYLVLTSLIAYQSFTLRHHFHQGSCICSCPASIVAPASKVTAWVWRAEIARVRLLKSKVWMEGEEEEDAREMMLCR